MPQLPKPCLICGTPTRNQSKCDTCTTTTSRIRKKHIRKNTRELGYGTSWRRLSEKARQLQPFCSDCGSTTDLQADHSPEAWQRYYAGKPIRLKDIDVVCGPCNRARGQARPGDTGQPGRAIEPRRQRHLSITFPNSEIVGLKNGIGGCR